MHTVLKTEAKAKTINVAHLKNKHKRTCITNVGGYIRKIIKTGPLSEGYYVNRKLACLGMQ